MATVSPTTVLRNDQLNEKFFYYLERTGFSTVGAAVFDFCSQVTSDKALFTLKHVTIIDNDKSNIKVSDGIDNTGANAVSRIDNSTILHDSKTKPNTLFGNLWYTANAFSSVFAVTITDPTTGLANAKMRVRSIASAGNGYTKGTTVYYYDGVKTPLTVTITSINSVTGGVTGFMVDNPGSYDTPKSSNKSMVYRIRANPLATLVSNLDYSGSEYTFQGNVVNSTGGALTDQQIPDVDPTGYATTAEWTARHGENGSGLTTYDLRDAGYATANVTGSGTRQPIVGIWTNQDPNEKFFVGQEILLSSAVWNTSFIPPGTTIANIHVMNVVSGLGEQQEDDKYYEKFNRYCSFTLSNPVSVKKGDKFVVRGAGFAINDTVTTEPDLFKVIMEASGQLDPLNDSSGVSGNIASSITNSNTFVVNNIVNQLSSTLPPEIYPGMRLIAGNAAVTTIANSPVVTSVTINYTAKTANIVVSKPQTINNGDRLIFKYEDLQPWRLGFEIPDPQVAVAYAATQFQLTDDGKIARVTNYQGNVVDRSGMMGDAIAFFNSDPDFTTPEGAVKVSTTIETYGLGSNIAGNLFYPKDRIDSTRPELGFYNRKRRVGDHPEAYPLTYTFSMKRGGMFFGLSEGNWSVAQKSLKNFLDQDDNWFNWFLIQRPVDRITGRVLTTGRAPVFCLNSVAYKYWKFIVRESDALHPTQGDPEQLSEYLSIPDDADLQKANVQVQVTPFRVPADQHTDDSHAILNTTYQIALTEDSKYLISFLHNLTTPRFRYSEELDLLGQTSADVCMAGNDISITAYNESTARTYKALPANKPYNTGMRICVLKSML